MKVFLTGATGYIGSAVTERLRGAGHEVSALARSDAGKKAETLLGWRPSRPNVLEDLEHGSYVPAERSSRR